MTHPDWKQPRTALPIAKALKMRQIPETRFCTIAEIAKRTELGTTTIHRAIQNERSVSMETRNAIYAAIVELNEEAIHRYRQELSTSRNLSNNTSLRIPGSGEMSGSHPMSTSRQEYS
ncbi:LacI family DNA-binding transcriptional regulator [Rhizobium sp. ICMP 5592]|uniref:LacI family DNA-binding transcriptional regulator n=1 Tax=Rhizobium sp. ICMP 5592 TaxID=2292445 RepID=UPI00188689AF|nr:LacI family DNA-binding transcriptional regulator [Rhizobium sp. ICMP 5592]